MAHKVWKCLKCNTIIESGLKYENGICKKCGEKVVKVIPSKEETLQHIKTVNVKCGNMSFDEELKKACKLFDLHDFALPYIPENYGKKGYKKVLHIGESNYIDGEAYESVLREVFCDNWWDTKLDIIDLFESNYGACWDGDYTRYVLDSFGKGYSDYFANYKLLGETFFKINGNPNPDEKEVREWYYNNIAFTDFFKMPCTKIGGSFERDLAKQRKRENFTKKEARYFKAEVILNSITCLNDVIEILDPDVVLFGTKMGYDYYTNSKYNKKYELLCKERKVYCLYHPGYARYMPSEDRKRFFEDWENTVKEIFE